MNPPSPTEPTEDESNHPVRTCVGCRSRRPQTELVRLVRHPDGSVSIGRTLAGRGAWLCRDDPTCFDTAVDRNGLQRAFRAPLRPEAIERLRHDLNDHIETR